MPCFGLHEVIRFLENFEIKRVPTITLQVIIKQALSCILIKSEKNDKTTSG